jgi:hypothetical protein
MIGDAFSVAFQMEGGTINIGKDNDMAKGEQRGNREAKKPKAEKPKTLATAGLGISPAKPGGSKSGAKK